MKSHLIKSATIAFLLLTVLLGSVPTFASTAAPILRKGASGSQVKKLQTNLKQLGFFTQNPTGYYGDATVTAVRKFQKKYNIPATGVVATLTYNKLNTLLKASVKASVASKAGSSPAKTVQTAAKSSSSTAAQPAASTKTPRKTDGLKAGMTSAAVDKLQKDLKTLGYMKVSATGNFGSITESALIQFQKNFGLEPSGIAGTDTLAVIERLIRQVDTSSRGEVSRVVFEPLFNVKLQWIPGVPKAPFLKGVGKYQGVVIHFTENMKDTAQIEADYERTHWYRAFVHEFIDPKEIIQVADPDYRAWGAGEHGNDRFIHLELCHADSRSDFDASFDMITQRAAEYLYSRQLGVSPAKADGSGTLWGHMDVSKYLGGTNHQDPIAYLRKWGVSWDDVIRTVTEKYNALESGKAQQAEGRTGTTDTIENGTDTGSMDAGSGTDASGAVAGSDTSTSGAVAGSDTDANITTASNSTSNITTGSSISGGDTNP